MEAELKKLTEAGPNRETIISVRESKEIADAHINIRGSAHSLGDVAPRGFLSVVAVSHPPAIPADQSGRLQLAQWLASPENPLPHRVIVNRAWHWLTGSGLVRTTDNFGTTGEAPSNPELLDYLATTFADGGGSMKKLIRQIVLSRAYRLSTANDVAAAAGDPENRLNWRMNHRRLDAECIRDAMLRASASLNLDQAGGAGFDRALKSDFSFKQTDASRRSVYLPVFRNALPEIFEVFDFADPSVSSGRRNVSTVAPQALFMLNHPFVSAQAAKAADRLLAEPSLTDDQRLARAYRLALGRSPDARERAVARSFLGGAASEGPEGEKGRWAELFHALFASMDFRYVD